MIRSGVSPLLVLVYCSTVCDDVDDGIVDCVELDVDVLSSGPTCGVDVVLPAVCFQLGKVVFYILIRLNSY